MCARRPRVTGYVNGHDCLDDLHHVRWCSAIAPFAAHVCTLERAAYDNRRFGSGSHRIGSHANCRSCAFHNNRARTVGARVGHELPPGDRRRQPHDGPCHGYFRREHRVVFMGRRTSAERIFLLVAARGGWLLRSFSERGFVSVLRVLRAGNRAEVFSYCRLRIDQQGIRGDEADALFVFWRHARIHRDPYRVRNCRIAGSESVVAIPIFAATAIVGISRVISRFRCTRRNLAAAYMGADGARRCAYSRLDASSRDRYETWLVCRTARGDESLSTGLPNVEQMDRLSGSRWNCLCRGGCAPPV